MIVSKVYSFKATHHVGAIVGCDVPHEHSYRMQVFIRGERNDDDFVIDFRDIDKPCEELVALWDGGDLNEFVTNPTAEEVAIAMQTYIDEYFPQHDVKVRLYETERAYAETDWGSHLHG